MILYLDCTSGISGDMLVAALLDLVAATGVADPLDELVRPALASVGVDPGLVSSGEVRRGGIAARAFTVAEAPGHDTFADLVAAVTAAPLSPPVSAAVVAIAGSLADAEALVHGGDVDHLHELSGIDTLVDLLAAAVLLDRLAPERRIASPPALGSGSVRTAHGLVSVPAPAVSALLLGAPTAGGQGAPVDEPLGELTTPTGAALLRHYTDEFATLPAGRIAAVAYGAGQREVPGRPNVIRALLIDAALSTPARHDYVLLETNIDDMSAELLAHAAEALRLSGARDVWLSDALMKKGRPGAVLHVLCDAADRERFATAILAETSSFGVRVMPLDRLHADERKERVAVAGEQIGVRLGYVAGRLVTASPEYEDVRRVAEATGRTAAAVYEAAQAAARDRFDSGAASIAPR